ncbi:MAG: hypothetical protein HYV09_31195 [Deltaproteobacteria bacterium]|nr:hypothetical protein [Deltaproteobacteria bacterium]
MQVSETSRAWFLAAALAGCGARTGTLSTDGPSCPELPPSGPCGPALTCDYPELCDPSTRQTLSFSCTGEGATWTPVTGTPCGPPPTPEGCPSTRPVVGSVCPEHDMICKYPLCDASAGEGAGFIWYYICVYDETGLTTRWGHLPLRCDGPPGP